jgi:hypothetical protein
MKLCDLTVDRRFLVPGLSQDFWVRVVISRGSGPCVIGQAIPEGATVYELAVLLRTLAARIEAES